MDSCDLHIKESQTGYAHIRQEYIKSWKCEEEKKEKEKKQLMPTNSDPLASLPSTRT